MTYRFGNCELDVDAFELRCEGERQPVEPRVIELLRYLIENRDRLVTKDEIFENIWNGRIVSDSALSSQIKAARRAIGDDGRNQSLLRTIHGKGFRFVGDLSGEEATAEENRQTGHQAVAGTDTGADRHHSERPAIAVLPFANLSEDPDQEYFSDGISSDLVTALSKFHAFLVISHNSTLVYKGQVRDAKTVSQDLDARYIVEGSVRRAGDRVRVNVALIEGETGTDLWAEHYDRDLGDIFAVQDDIVRNVATAIGLQFVEAEHARALKTEPESMNAWDLAMRASWHMSRWTNSDNAKALELLCKAIEINPTLAHNHALLASVYVVDAIHGWQRPSEESAELALKSAQTAVSLDAFDALALTVLGGVQVFRRQPQSAIVTLEKAAASNPNLARAFGQLAIAYGHCGNYEACLRNLNTAMRLSPRDNRSHWWKAGAALAAFAQERYDEAIEFGREIVASNPEFVGGHRILAACFGYLGDEIEAAEAMRELLHLVPTLTAEKVRSQVPYAEPSVLDRYVEGLIDAGLPAQ